MLNIQYDLILDSYSGFVFGRELGVPTIWQLFDGNIIAKFVVRKLK